MPVSLLAWLPIPTHHPASCLQALTVLTNLRKICNHPSLCPPAALVPGEGSACGAAAAAAAGGGGEEFDPDQSGGVGVQGQGQEQQQSF